jgi:hypothetical protein
MMKKLIGIIVVLFVIAFAANADIRWPFGDVTTVTGGSNDTVDISSELTRGINVYTITNDTNMVINVTTVASNWEAGEFLFISATEGSGSADTLRYGTNITGNYDPIPAGKTWTAWFFWNGTAWVKISSNQID